MYLASSFMTDIKLNWRLSHQRRRCRVVTYAVLLLGSLSSTSDCRRLQHQIFTLQFYISEISNPQSFNVSIISLPYVKFSSSGYLFLTA